MDNNYVFINGERFRMVDRKAAVGERVVAVSTTYTVDDDTDVMHEIGELGVVTARGDYYPNRVKINGYYVVDEDYRVLEPLKAAAPTPLLSAQPPIDQAATTISALQANYGALAAQVMALEKRVAALEGKNSVWLPFSVENAPATVKVTSGPVDDAPPSFAKLPRVKTAQQIRDEIVERAKATVRDYERIYGLTFIVNKEKRTVVALRIYQGRVVDRAVAKCAPNDVFNSHIGKVIAGKSLLGSNVPAEYLSVPNPEEPRVGDELRWNDGWLFRLTGIDGDDYSFYSHRTKRHLDDVPYAEGISQYCRVIDDSREEVAA